MQHKDEIRFAKIMMGLAENFSAKLSDAGLEMRLAALREYSIEQIEAAAMSILRTRKYTSMPTVADFIEAIDGKDEDRGERQALFVLAQVRRIGVYGSPLFEDPLTEDLVSNRFGWRNICQMQERDLKFFIRDFCEAYASRLRTAHIPELAIPGVEVRRLISGLVKEGC